MNFLTRPVVPPATPSTYSYNLLVPPRSGPRSSFPRHAVQTVVIVCHAEPSLIRPGYQVVFSIYCPISMAASTGDVGLSCPTVILVVAVFRPHVIVPVGAGTGQTSQQVIRYTPSCYPTGNPSNAPADPGCCTHIPPPCLSPPSFSSRGRKSHRYSSTSPHCRKWSSAGFRSVSSYWFSDNSRFWIIVFSRFPHWS